MSDKDKKHREGSVPEGYFQNFGDRLNERLGREGDNIAENAPILYSLGKKEAYLFPDNYFSDFKVESPKRSNKIISLSTWAMGIAASMAVLIGVFLFTTKLNDTGDQFLASIEDEEMINYMMANVEAFDVADIYEMAELNSENLNDLELEQLDYLIENVTDLELYELEDL